MDREDPDISSGMGETTDPVSAMRFPHAARLGSPDHPAAVRRLYAAALTSFVVPSRRSRTYTS
ncbi:hypothetical protein KRM28CT15_45100 [Krasilnikovia sp. M28-CT-15]